MSDTDLKLRVFLCHASQDKPLVRELYQRLLAEDWIDPWLDEEKLLPGQDWDLEIEKAVEASDAVIAFLSSNSITKEGYVQKELRKVLDVADEKPEGTIFVVPFRIDDCQIPRRLKSWHYVDYFPVEQRDQADQRLLKSLSVRFSQLDSRADSTQQTYSETDSLIGWDEKWIGTHRSNAQSRMKKNGFAGFVEVTFSLLNRRPKSSQKDLLSAARKAQIHTFGWPIGIVLDTLEGSPKPQADGIKAEIESRLMSDSISSYDYWALRNNGDFYLMKSLFEDGECHWPRGTSIAFDTRIHRTTEILLYCQRLYDNLGVDPSAIVKIHIKHGGLRNRRLTTAKHRIFSRVDLVCTEAEIEKTIQVNLLGIRSNLVNLVKEFTQPLFLLFNYQEFADNIYENIVNNYAEGKVV
ncbi:MAG TPA: toll/interleukin-1 receptor domain-containing protein [Anaerolineales bacterium]|nr:toll/interleukin-1 receptor domain-containing protein [Anaerolineales bacterium]